MNKATAGRFSDESPPPLIVSLAIMVACAAPCNGCSHLSLSLEAVMQANRWEARGPATIEAPTPKGHPYGFSTFVGQFGDGRGELGRIGLS